MFFGILILTALSTCVASAEILSVSCNKSGVMYYEGNGNQKGTVDELFQFTVQATGDTQKVMMQGTGGSKFVIAENTYGKLDKSKEITLRSIEYVSTTEGRRTFRFWSVDYNGAETEYPHTIALDCYRRDNSERTVYSAEVKNNVVQILEGSEGPREKMEFVICTSINACELQMTTEAGSVVTNIAQHCAERGSCDIKDGKKYWSVYFFSVIPGERRFTFQASDNSGNPVGDTKTVSVTVLSEEEYDKQGSGGEGKGNQPGTDEGLTKGDDKNATGNKDGVENGKDGNSDSPESSSDNNGNDNNQPSQTNQNSVSSGNGGNCCKKEDFLSISAPKSVKTIIIEFPDGEKYNAIDQEKKNLASFKETENEKKWDIWVGDEHKKEDLKFVAYDENYNPVDDYTVSEKETLTEEELEKYEPAVRKELAIDLTPHTKTIKLVINDEYMYIDGKSCEVDPGRCTKPLILNGRTLLPVRAIIEALGGKIGWDEKESKVSIDIFDKELNFWIGSTKMTWNSIPETIDVAPQTINARTMLPIRFITECFKELDISWEEAAQTVTIIYTYY